MDEVFVLYDRHSNSVWYPVGENLDAVGGARKGSSIPFLDEPAPVALADWMEHHPNSTVLLPSERDYRTLTRPVLGIRLEETDQGVRLRRVVEASPASVAGFRAGDVLRKFDGRPVTTRDDLRDILDSLRAGDTVKVVVERDGRKKTLRPTLEAR